MLTLHTNILLGQGLENVHLGQNILTLRDEIAATPNDWTIELVSTLQKGIPDVIDYTFKDSIRLRVNLYLGVIASIQLYNQYKGSFCTYYGLGTLVNDLQDAEDFRVSFDEEYVLINSNELILSIDNNNDTIDSLEEVAYDPVTSILLEHPTYARNSYHSEELMELWKMTVS